MYLPFQGVTLGVAKTCKSQQREVELLAAHRHSGCLGVMPLGRSVGTVLQS